MEFIFLSVRNFFVSIKDTHELFLEKLIRLSIYLEAFLLPLFFLPFPSNFSEFNKAILFYSLTFLGIIFWLIKIFLNKKVNLQLKFLDVTLFLFLIIYSLASLFSVDRYQSFWGSNYLKATSFLTILFSFCLYLLVSRFINSYGKVKKVFYCLDFSLVLTLALSIIKMIKPNYWLSFFNLGINTFNLLLLLGFILSLVLFWLESNKILKIFNLIFSIIFLATLFLIGDQYLLLLLVITFFLFILFFSLKAEVFSNKLVVSLTLLLFLSVLILLLPISKWTNLISLREFSLPANYGWQITKTATSDNLILGVGPQNFAYSFYKYKPLDFNTTNFWQLGFEKNSNWWLEILSGTGLLGLLLILIIIVKYFSQFIGSLRKYIIFDSGQRAELIILITNALILAILILAGFLFNFDLIIVYIFFLFLALGVGLIQASSSGNLFYNKTIINLFCYVAAILLLCFAYFTSKIFIADTYAEQAIISSHSSVAEFKLAEDKLFKAQSLNPANKNYNLQLLNLAINQADLENQEGKLDQAGFAEKIIANLNLILGQDSNQYDNYLLLQQDLTMLKSLGFATADLAREINRRMIMLNPNNPELYIDRALINFDQYLLVKNGQMQLSEQENDALLNKIKADLEKSLALKNNFTLGYFNLGLYYQEMGDEKKALENIEQAYQLDPSQKLIVLSLKKIYINQDRIKDAEDILNKYLTSEPAANDVRLELAAVYKDNKELDKAKEELRKILSSEPNNLAAKQLLSQIK